MTKTEWDIFLSYTRRIRRIRKYGLDKHQLGEKFVSILSNPPTSATVFPHLRALYFVYTETAVPLLHLPLPSLVSLDIQFPDASSLQNSVKSLPNFPPNITSLSIFVYHYAITTIEPNYFRHWQNLCYVRCLNVTLDVDNLADLSRMPALAKLDIMLSPTMPTSDSPLCFSTLHTLNLDCESWHPMSWLLSRTRMPAIKHFFATVGNNPSRQELAAFFAGVLTASAGGTLGTLGLPLWQRDPNPLAVRSRAPLLCLEDLRPCMALSNLRKLYIDMEWNVGLTDADLLTLAAAWPRLEILHINLSWGWNTLGGITPNGLVQLLHRCRSLYDVSLALDTRKNTEFPPSGSLATLASRPLPVFHLNVIDSILEDDSVPAIVAFLADIPCSSLFLPAWSSVKLNIRPDFEVYFNRWFDVLEQVRLRS